MNNRTFSLKSDLVDSFGLISIISIIGYIFFSYLMSWSYDHIRGGYSPAAAIPTYYKELIILPILILLFLVILFFL